MKPTIKQAALQAQALRSLAAMIEHNPELGISTHYCHINTWFTENRGELAHLARVALDHGATVEKDAAADVFVLRVSWPGLTYQALAMRESVCERVHVGSKMITEMVPEHTVPMVSVQREVAEYEWQCGPILAATKINTERVAPQEVEASR